MLAGGVIRTATETFTKEPASLINFILQAFAAEIQNKARTDAIAGSFRKSIRDGKYPLVAPLGYEKTEDDRIVKTSDPKLRAACQDVAPTFLLSQTKTFVETSSNIERVHGIKFRPPVIRNMLTSPFYEGKIGLCGEVQYNPSLAYRSEEETAQIARILADKGARYARKADEIFQVQVFSDVGNVYEFMRKLHEH